MQITYINHSSFSIELEQHVLLFDYFSPDKTRSLAGIPEFQKDKQIIVFVSHKHHDHLDYEIFLLAEQYPSVSFLVSKDARMTEAFQERRQIPKKARQNIRYAGADETLLLGGVKVETLKSTDAGVAFLVTCEGKCFYHAGDLNWWSWSGETEQQNKEMEKAFQTEIKKIEGREFDAAFLPLDPRQEERFYWGFDYFMQHTRTHQAYPMHFWNDVTVIERLKALECSVQYRDKIAAAEVYC